MAYVTPLNNRKPQTVAKLAVKNLIIFLNVIEKRFVQSPSKFCLTLSKCFWWALSQMDTQDKSKASAAPGYFFAAKLKNIPRVSVSVSLLSAKLSFDKCEVGGGKEIQGQALPPLSPSGPPPDKKCSINDVMGGAVGLCSNWPLQWECNASTVLIAWAERNSALARPLSKFRHSASSSPEDVFRYRFAGL